MTDPVSGAAAGSAQKVAEQAGTSAVEETGESSGSSFDEVLADVQESAEAATTDGAGAGVREVDGARSVERIEEIEGPAKARMDDFIHRINGDQKEIETMLQRGMGGGEMSQKDLLQVQALIYGHAQRVELTTKVVSNATKGMKQVMNTQV